MCDLQISLPITITPANNTDIAVSMPCFSVHGQVAIGQSGFFVCLFVLGEGTK
jgi:hypothetical protein